MANYDQIETKNNKKAQQKTEIKCAGSGEFEGVTGIVYEFWRNGGEKTA